METPKVIKLPYHGPRELREEHKGWLKIWWISDLPGNEPPSRRQYCSKRQVASILKYWQESCQCLMKHEWQAEGVVSVLDTILANDPKLPTLNALARILG